MHVATNTPGLGYQEKANGDYNWSVGNWDYSLLSITWRQQEKTKCYQISVYLRQEFKKNPHQIALFRWKFRYLGGGFE